MLKLRPATFYDWARLFHWRNDPVTLENSFDSVPVTLDAHLKWLRTHLRQPQPTAIFIARDLIRGVEIGQCRLDPTDKKGVAECSIAIDPQQRGHGYAPQMLALLATEARAKGFKKVIARVKESNTASLRAFANVGFTPVSVEKGVAILEAVT